MAHHALKSVEHLTFSKINTSSIDELILNFIVQLLNVFFYPFLANLGTIEFEMQPLQKLKEEGDFILHQNHQFKGELVSHALSFDYGCKRAKPSQTL